jgi:PPK2 family polyphosphate:nucleotide phosphotransferase
MSGSLPGGDRLRALLRVKPGSHVDFSTTDAGETYGRKEEALAGLEDNVGLLASLQDRLYAGAKHAVLIVLQGMDTAGKDGTIKHVMTGLNPQGVTVAPFKVPTPEEAAHDFLWRVHRQAPAKGMIAIFNRSHYEQVLVVRVHGLEPEESWRRHYDQVNEFEQGLVENGTTILKFFLHLSRDEQRRRLQDRVDTPQKQWKFRKADLEERKYWEDYQRAYEDALSKCSTEVAPWYVVPADHNWFRNYAVAEILAHTLQGLDLRYPDPEPGMAGLVVQ